MFRLAAVIPTYNNPLTLHKVVEGVKRYCSYIIVIDDGSDREGAEAAENISGIDLIRNGKNIGKGPSLGKGLKRASDLGYTHVVTIDADGQHFPEDIINLASAAEKEPDVIWIGNRELGCENMPGKNTFANKFSNFWFWAETGVKLSDTQSGYRVYPLNRLAGIRVLSGRYEWELEILVRAVS